MTDPKVIEALRALTTAASWMLRTGRHADGRASDYIALAREATNAVERPTEKPPEPVVVPLDPTEFAVACLQNSGVDVKCGACMEVAFTGATAAPHTCVKKPAPASTLPWVVRWVASKKEIARCDAESDARTLRDLYVTSAVEVAPAIVPVRFNADNVALGDGWTADFDFSESSRTVILHVDLRPGEDAGVLVAKILASVGRAA